MKLRVHAVATIFWSFRKVVVYATCLYCHQPLGSNESVEHFPVGQRLAFDPWKGRLWVVCPHCRQWNLTPIEERFEAVEECERLFRGTITRLSTEQIGLAVLRSGLELVRIGKPLRPEFAAWRYTGNFLHRRTLGYVTKGARVAEAGLVTVAAGGLFAAVFTSPGAIATLYLGVYPAIAAVPIIGVLMARDYLKNDRVVARFSREGRLLTVRARHAGAAEMHLGGTEATTLTVPHDDGRLTFDGTEAMQAAGIILASSNDRGGNKAVVDRAVQQIEASGSVDGFLQAATRRATQRRGRMLTSLGGYRSLGAMNLSPPERLALEMAVHEETERRAMEGELEVLEAAWRDAEEIAAISDGELTPMRLPDWLTRRR